MSNILDCWLDVTELVMDVASSNDRNSSNLGQLGQSFCVVNQGVILLNEFAKLCLDVALEKYGV